MMTHPKSRALKGSPEALGDARRRFYEIYALVRAALPEDVTHEEVCAILDDLAKATYAGANDDQSAMSQLWEGRDERDRHRR
ncbi:MAG: hypothetical protein V2I45_03270 [Halieaceae bacterium]|jgi:hypothetical protein|nr:hypothetical protein [Halieaceae bacterium]